MTRFLPTHWLKHKDTSDHVLGVLDVADAFLTVKQRAGIRWERCFLDREMQVCCGMMSSRLFCMRSLEFVNGQEVKGQPRTCALQNGKADLRSVCRLAGKGTNGVCKGAIHVLSGTRIRWNFKATFFF